MADNEIDEPLEEGSDESVEGEEGSPQKKWQISKPTLIKIGIGLAILLLGAGIGVGTVLLFSSDEKISEPVKTEVIEEEDEFLEEDADLEETITEGTIELPEMVLENQEEVSDVEGVPETVNKPSEAIDLPKMPVANTQAMLDDPASADSQEATAPTIEEQKESSKSKVIPSRYIVDYKERSSSYPWDLPQPEAISEPAPEPKWGEFDRLGNK
ncbi:MAG: hypothetical protein OEW63_08875 [Gammaproteobacteria bacterium]|nr:hypothetical protein [Gammaproteobacteria bacterium]